MFLDWKNQHCETDYTTQSNLQIQCNPSQITNGILHRIRIKIFAMFMETQKTTLAKAILKKKKRESWSNQAPDFILYYKATVTTTVWYWHKKQKRRSMIWDKNPKINLRTCGHLAYDKGGKNIQWIKDSLFDKWYRENWTATSKRMKLKHSLTLYTKINPKWIKDLNLRLDTIKLFVFVV